MITLVVEDGTGLPNANSYVTEQEVTTYLSSFSDTNFYVQSDYSSIIAQTALLMNGLFRYAGSLKNDMQSLAFPRLFCGQDVFPIAILKRVQLLLITDYYIFERLNLTTELKIKSRKLPETTVEFFESNYIGTTYYNMQVFDLLSTYVISELRRR